MRKFRTIKYYVDNNLTTLSQKQLKRNVIVAMSNNDCAVRLIKNSRNRNQYEIDENNCGHLIKRKNKRFCFKVGVISRPNYISLKSDYKNDFYNKGANLFGKKKCNNIYNVEVTINLKLFRSNGKNVNNTYNKDVYELMVKIFKGKFNNFFYKIELDESCNYHLHMGIEGEINIVKSTIFETVFDNFGFFDNESNHSLDGEKQYAIKIQEMVDQDLYINYISKGNDGLGGDLPIFFTR